MKIYAVLVIYNQHLSDCPSFYSASKESDVQLLVVDNSTDELFQNQEEARRAGAWFLSMDGNQGLAKAYNAAFDFLRCKMGTGLFCSMMIPRFRKSTGKNSKRPNRILYSYQ